MGCKSKCFNSLQHSASDAPATSIILLESFAMEQLTHHSRELESDPCSSLGNKDRDGEDNKEKG